MATDQGAELHILNVVTDDGMPIVSASLTADHNESALGAAQSALMYRTRIPFVQALNLFGAHMSWVALNCSCSSGGASLCGKFEAPNPKMEPGTHRVAIRYCAA